MCYIKCVCGVPFYGRQKVQELVNWSPRICYVHFTILDKNIDYALSVIERKAESLPKQLFQILTVKLGVIRKEMICKKLIKPIK